MEKRDIFLNDKDKNHFLSLLQNIPKKYPLKIYSYCLMNNHYHLLVGVKQRCLSEAMHYLSSSYVAYFNKKWDRVGPLFQSRFKSILIENDTYLMELTRYIHLNPVRANIARNPKDYEWSSFKDYVSIKEQDWIEINWMLNLFGSDKEMAVARYIQFVEKGMNLPVWDVEKRGGATGAIGSVEFVEKVRRLNQSCG